MTVLVAPRHRPHELLLLVTSVIIGGSYLVGYGRPTFLLAVRPQWIVYVWAAGMLVAGVAGVAGCLGWRRNPVRALTIEQAAMDTGAAAVAFYLVALLALAGARGISVAVIFAGWVAANLWRGRVISKDLRQLRTGAR